jgi:hypothetical protein
MELISRSIELENIKSDLIFNKSDRNIKRYFVLFYIHPTCQFTENCHVKYSYVTVKTIQYFFLAMLEQHYQKCTHISFYSKSNKMQQILKFILFLG